MRIRLPRIMKAFFHRKWTPRCACAVVGVAITVLVLLHWYPSKQIEVAMPLQCRDPEQARMNTDLVALMKTLADPNERNAHAWIRMRIGRLWPGWVRAAESKVVQDIFTHKQRRRKKILLYLGFLAKASGLKFAENQFKGGWLGELVQWSDLIASLYILGHDVTVISEVEQFKEHGLFFEPVVSDSCGSVLQNTPLIYTDIHGYRHILRHIDQPEYYYKCRIRIMDCYGTEPAYNDKLYISTHNMTSHWGGLDLNTQQFLTMFPHSPDNSFVGFVVPTDFTNGQNMAEYKENIAVVYGKTPDVWVGKEEYLKVFHQNGLTLQSTLKKDDENKDPEVLPKFVNNHGYMNGSAFPDLLKKTKIYIGLGEPYEGPAPLEAISSGAVYVNPKFHPPVKYRNRGKPNERELRSQNPYVENYIGAPYVYTVNIKNLVEVDNVIKKILKANHFKSYLPFEFSFEGTIQRMSSYVENQDFCNAGSQYWPPEGAVRTVYGLPGRSCKDTCETKGLICEPSHFERINTKSSFTYNCSQYLTQSDLYFPAIDINSNTCTMQNNRKWFSCVGGHRKLVRACPCRNYIPQQTALCKGCD